MNSQNIVLLLLILGGLFSLILISQIDFTPVFTPYDPVNISVNSSNPCVIAYAGGNWTNYVRVNQTHYCLE